MNSLRAPLMQFVPGRHSVTRITAWLLLAAMAATVFAACVSENDLTPEQRAYSLDKQLMCPICDGETIDQSQSQLAKDMKAVLREKIAAGETNAEIRDYFVERYGEVVLAAPEASGFNLLVWVMPVVIAGGGGLAVIWVLKNMRRNSPAFAEAEQKMTLADRQLEKYLDKVDADIGYTQTARGKKNPTDEQESVNS